MADYRELLRRAVEALPENNGASRRQVYEKARSALVGQLRAIDPPLPAREITQHRLQLEDCIRQVEQSATDILLGGLATLTETDGKAKDASKENAVETAPVVEAETAPEAETVLEAETTPKNHEEAASEVTSADTSDPDFVESEDDEFSSAAYKVEGLDLQVQPSDAIEKLLEEAEAEKPVRQSPKPGSIDYLIAQAQAAAERAAIPTRWKTDSTSAELSSASDGDVAVAERVVEPEEMAAETIASNVAMSSVREVEVEPGIDEPGKTEADKTDLAKTELGKAEPENKNGQSDPQGAIDRAIETLDREARGEDTGLGDLGDDAGSAASSDETSSIDEQSGGGNALTIFLFLFVLLLAGVGGAGYWAWREGYVDLDAMFGQSDPIVDVAASDSVPDDTQSGPGNTVATPNAVATVSSELSKSEERLPSEENLVELAPVTEEMAPIASASTGDDKTEARLPTDEVFAGDEPSAAEATGDAAQADVPAKVNVAPIGSQSLLLEVSREGTTGAVPFSGTVDWSRGVDELGVPTLLARANIPARNLSVDVLLRRNSDPTLPASHLMEIDFSVSDSFIGGAVAGLPGVLFKNEELVEGVPLRGASARVVGNSFLFALSAAEQDISINTTLMQTRKWMDLALVYATGVQAIITLEKDAAAQVLFDEVMALWAEDTTAVSTGQ